MVSWGHTRHALDSVMASSAVVVGDVGRDGAAKVILRHEVENLARHLHLNSLSVQGSTSHTSTDDRLVSVHGILDQAPLTVA